MASGVSTAAPCVDDFSVIFHYRRSGPMHYGNYDLVVMVSAPGGCRYGFHERFEGVREYLRLSATSTKQSPTTCDEPASDATNLGITLQPGMSVTRDWMTCLRDTDDMFAYNTGTAASVTVYISWAGHHNVTLYFMTCAEHDGPKRKRCGREQHFRYLAA